MKMIINGKAVDAADGKVIEVTNPATGEVIDTVPAATKEDIDLAVAEAVRAQKTWAKVPVHEKADIMYRFLDMVDAEKEDLAQTLSAETGKPIVEARGDREYSDRVQSIFPNGRNISTERRSPPAWRQGRKNMY